MRGNTSAFLGCPVKFQRSHSGGYSLSFGQQTRQRTEQREEKRETTALGRSDLPARSSCHPWRDPGRELPGWDQSDVPSQAVRGDQAAYCSPNRSNWEFRQCLYIRPHCCRHFTLRAVRFRLLVVVVLCKKKKKKNPNCGGHGVYLRFEAGSAVLWFVEYRGGIHPV